MRASGSGTIDLPVPDVIGVKGGQVIIIECKTTNKDKISLKKAVISLKEFSKRAGGKAYIAIKFPRQKDRFYDIEDLLLKKNFTVSEKDEYLTLETIIGKQVLL